MAGMDRQHFEDLFRSVRESCSPAIWSKGVELARRDAVTGDREDTEEVALRVLNHETAVSAQVSLWLTDGDWTCSCRGADDPCAHVAAAVIAMKRALEQGQSLPQSKSAGGRLGYRLYRTDGALSFERVILQDGRESPLEVPLKAVGEGRSHLPISPTTDDYGIENALGSDRRGILRRETWVPLLTQLSKGMDITLDGQPVRCSPDGMGRRIRIVDEAPLVRLISEWDPAIQERFSNGVVLTRDGVLHPLAEPRELSPTEYSIIKSGRTVGPQLFGELVGEILPALRKKLPVVVESRLLPQEVDEAPRLEVELLALDDRLVVTPSIVYGDPPVAKVWEGVLKPLGRQIPTRDLATEHRLADQCRRDFGLEAGHSQVFRGIAAVEMRERLMGRRGHTHFVGDGITAFARRKPLQVQVNTSVDDVSIQFISDDGSASVDVQRALDAWERDEPLVPLRDGGWAPLPKDWLQRHGAALRGYLQARQMLPEKSPLQKMAQVQFLQDTGFTPSPALLQFAELTASQMVLPTAILPKDLTVALRPYQLEGVAWLQQMRRLGLGGLLADDMGLGKTLQTMAVFLGPALVVAPTSVLPNWERELQRFRPGLRLHRYYGQDRRFNTDADVTLTTYAILRLDTEKLAEQTWDTIVLDEAQAIKNPQSQTAQAAFALRGGFRVALTGTPVENRLDDLWSLFAFINPGYLGPLKEFREHFARPIAQGDTDIARYLQRRIKPMVLRRMKQEVARDLPPKTEAVLFAELSAAERSLYEAMELAARRDVLAALAQGGSVMEALETLLRLRQAACHPALLPGQDQAAATSGKVELLLDRLGEAVAEGHKALVFSQWTRFLDLVEPHLAAADMKFLRIDGQTRDRDAVVQAFQRNDGPPVLLMSLKAGGVGLNLTAADHVFILDPWWNPATEEQAADRAYRIGQDKPVFVHPIVSLGTIEERIQILKERKRHLADILKPGVGESAAALNREDLLMLIGGA